MGEKTSLKASRKKRNELGNHVGATLRKAQQIAFRREARFMPPRARFAGPVVV